MSPTELTAEPPTVAAIQLARRELGTLVRETPAWIWQGHRVDAQKPAGSTVSLKLELFQHGGSFKVRGALLTMRRLSPEQLARGVTAVSAGNHAMAVAFAARSLGTHAKVVMPANANPARVEASRVLGAEVVLTPDIATAFATTRQLEQDEGRYFVHPFEGQGMVLGAATLGMEFLRQTGQLDVLFVPIGGGGLAAGVACAVKQLQPRCRVIGVEPTGADSMHRSFAAGSPQRIEAVTTIADSLGAPMAMPYSFALCKRFVDELVKVDDDELCRAMWLLFADAKLAVEPAGAATTAAMLQGRERFAGQRIGLIVCGANVDAETFAKCLQRGAPR
ncbi:MAG TPA: threonine/serine dehydratase, partial [Planctomycetota bacterium]|nr:threonine/serine dehydratase [Planctomycetota bacterium]